MILVRSFVVVVFHFVRPAAFKKPNQTHNKKQNNRYKTKTHSKTNKQKYKK